MKAKLCFLLLCPLSIFAADMTTKDGKVYKNVQIKELVINHSTGESAISFNQLTAEQQKKISALLEAEKVKKKTKKTTKAHLKALEQLTAVHHYAEVLQILQNGMLCSFKDQEVFIEDHPNQKSLVDGAKIATDYCKHPEWNFIYDETAYCKVCCSRSVSIHHIKDAEGKTISYYAVPRSACIIYRIGNIRLQAADGSVRTLRRFTCSRSKALEYIKSLD
ncbi:MAG: hypothetical protein E7056_02510 [Lentisphaerae bacterium]|nr:hypothetical protein [Lentisphaerota bacterium]